MLPYPHTPTRQHPRARWFMYGTFLLILAGAVLFTYLSLASEEKNTIQDIERRMELQAQNKVAALTLWNRSLESQITHITDADIFRLFASEIAARGENAQEIISLAANESALAQRSDEESQLAGQLPLMKNLLREFTTLSHFQSAKMITPTGLIYLSSGESSAPLTASQQELVASVFATGVSASRPIRLDTMGLFMDSAYPLFPPEYVAHPGDKPVSVLLLSIPVSDRIKEILTSENRFNDAGTTKLLQQVHTIFQLVQPESSPQLLTLPGWTAPLSGPIHFHMRQALQGNGDIFFLGLKVEALPLYVVEVFPVSEALAPFWSYRNNFILLVCISTGIIFSLIGMVWWWSVGRQERAVAEEMTSLYKIVNEQKQLLDGINKTLPAGIVLTDTQGFIRYANPVFAAMNNRDISSLVGLDAEALFGYATAQRLMPYKKHCLSTGESVSFSEILWLRSKKFHYHIACAPFRNEQKEITGVVSIYRDITELVEAQERSQAIIQQTVTVLVRTIEAIDPYLCGQGAFTGELAGALVHTLHLSSSDETTVQTAANLFQIGMLSLPASLLTKSGSLTPEERAQMETHIEYTRAALKDIDFGLPVLDAIVQMYERMDGSGYPAHIQGDQINLHARILAAANTFCAMLRPRSYRQAKTVQEALAILRREPPQYDPQVVDALSQFLATPQGEKFVWELQHRTEVPTPKEHV